ncbi:hypothetical protein X739_11965 [Mesorhizobium sp. LNHC220B00]|nr:hypothetical protein [Mesorhizobium sp. LNHC220B00]ESY86408.1 hypothetical protein X739_11965 [Mesorhizobium sp. LNHC220B00]
MRKPTTTALSPVKVQITGGYSNVLPNKALYDLMYENMRRVGPPAFDSADYEFAKELRKMALTEEDALASVAGRDVSLKDKVLHDSLLPLGTDQFDMSSTDVGDVSRIVPTAQCLTACFAIGTSFHSWQLVTQGDLPAAHKGMILAAKVMASTAADCIRNPEVIARAKGGVEATNGGAPISLPNTFGRHAQ